MVTRVEKIENHFLEKIASNELKPGDRLPTVKEIRTILDVGHVTAANALKGLSDKGYITTVRGHGSFVSKKNTVSSKTLLETIIYACGHGRSPELTSFYMRAYQGAKDNAAFSGFDLDFVTVDLVESKEFDLGVTDGAVAVISDTDDILRQCIDGNLNEKGIRLVYCGMGSNLLAVNSVVPDNYTGAVKATEHLIKCGHQNISFVSVLFDEPDRRHSLRINGWKDTMKKASLDISDILTWHIYQHSDEITDLMKRIKAGDANVPTALLVTNDSMAAEVMKVALLLGLRIPQDLSIVGFENHYRATEPEITTVACSGSDFGREAVCLVEKVRAYPDCQPIHVHLPMQLLERGSVRNIR